MRIYVVVGFLCLNQAIAWRHFQSWSTRHWCEVLENPHWPFSYQKYTTQQWEEKGRTVSNLQDNRHQCERRGTLSKCHRCEDIACGPTLSDTCNYQIQGTDWNELPDNIPTVSDVPWAVGSRVQHRNDFSNSDRVCMWLSGGQCLQHMPGLTYEDCTLRCWGDSYDPPVPSEFGWEYPKSQGLPQGRVATFAGSGEAGYANGPAATAKFNNPQAVAVDRLRNVYVADTDNNRIRVISGGGADVRLVAGDGEARWLDGRGDLASFSHPTGITLYYDRTDTLVLLISDTFNHRIRKIVIDDPGNIDASLLQVTTLAGGACTVDGRTPAQSGLADGIGCRARFDLPHGIAADDDGTAFVADTQNRVIRRITTDGEVTTFAGKVVYDDRQNAGCQPPCVRGVQGYVDANLTESTFYNPYDVSISVNNTLLVSDGDRIRRITRSASVPSIIQGISSVDRVVTLGGLIEDGELDQIGQEATMDKPRGIMMAPDRRIYVADSAQCRIRRLDPADLIGIPIQCDTVATQVMRPSGCSLYELPVSHVDKFGRKVSPKTDNIYYNNHREDGWRIKNCQGSPPPDRGQTSSGVTVSANGGTGFTSFDVKEDTGDLTTIRLRCPPGCGVQAMSDTTTAGHSFVTGGNGYYADTSRVCAAAIHAGVLTDAGGLLSITLEQGFGPNAGSEAGGIGQGRALNSSVSNSVTSQAVDGWDRTFSIHEYPLATVELQTISGAPNAPLDDACGLLDAQPAQEAMFSGPAGLAMFKNASLSDTELLYIADAKNHVIRAMTAVCSKMCENGGRCTAAETCTCRTGWAGDDCTVPVCSNTAPTPRHICTGPDEWTCPPGWTGASCRTALCVQVCQHGGQCTAPDTCTCLAGWFDSNCTTPVCDQTCGNGANCTAPNTCTCPSQWTGQDCRTPVCTQICLNGGRCVAPDTCWCPPQWSGHDCSKPVCQQGFFVADPRPEHFAPSTFRQPSWTRYSPCEYDEWCTSVNEFDCQQPNRPPEFTPLPPIRDYSGYGASPPEDQCFRIEIRLDAYTPYRYENAQGTLTDYWRVTPITPFGWEPGSPNPWTSLQPSAADRQVAHVSWAKFPEGVYVCANGGNCTAPDTCVCAPGWIGYDCRTPICNQGYYEPFRPDPRYPGQGTYECSERSQTIWEAYGSANGKFGVVGRIHDHPNYYSRYMDEDKGWPEIHRLTTPLGNNTNEGWRRDGWWESIPGTLWEKGQCYQLYNRSCPNDLSKMMDLRDMTPFTPVNDTLHAFGPRTRYDNKTTYSMGRWFEAGGACIDDVLKGCFNNGTCVAPNTCECAPGWEGHDCSLPVCEQTVASVYGESDVPSTLLRRSGQNLGEPTSVPELASDTYPQYRKCANDGNCTHPNTCTCEKGWTGHDCTVPECAQQCFNNGNCTLPDLCTCFQWENTNGQYKTDLSLYEDNRDERRPVYRTADGNPQLTGWTGYDCNTPICTQAERWVPNDVVGSVRLDRTRNDGRSFQAGCEDTNRFTPPIVPWATHPKYPSESPLTPGDGVERTSESHLCGVVEWYEGVYTQSWVNKLDPFGFTGSRTSESRAVRVNHQGFRKVSDEAWVEEADVPGEGLYACYNKGSCVAPDTCECADGWEGFDCSTPLCRHLNANSQVVGCLNGGICSSRDNCTCIRSESVLHEKHPDAPRGETGFNGTDCAMAICVQGYYDPTCADVPPFSNGVSSGGEGCYRCANGGNCTAPDFCTCPPEWTGYDCRTPVCTEHADEQTIADLNTVDPERVQEFELDPCGQNVPLLHQGLQFGHGNCSAPDTCTCLCRSMAWYKKDGTLSEDPWQDPLGRELPPGNIFGRHECLSGFEGNYNTDGSFRSCHLTIYVPTWIERNSVLLIVLGILLLLLILILYIFIRRKLRQRYLLAKAERRRSRRSSEENEKPSALHYK